MTASTLAGYHLSSNYGPQGSGPSSASSSSNTLTFITPPLPLGQANDYHPQSQPSIVQSNGSFGGGSMQQYGSNYPPTGPDGRHDPSGYIYPSNGNGGPSSAGPGGSFMNSGSHQQQGQTSAPDRDGRFSDPNGHAGGLASPRAFQYPAPSDPHRSPYNSFSGPGSGGDNGNGRGGGYAGGPPPPGMPWSPPMTGHAGFGAPSSLPPPPPGPGMMTDHGSYGPPPPGTGSSSSYAPSRYPDQSGPATASSSSHGPTSGGSGRPVPYPSSKQEPGISGEDETDNRTRNAKAQKRHREKRKAHVKSLEETVAQLQQQMRAIRSGTHPEFVPVSSQYGDSNGGGGGGNQPLMAQNDYLREENDRLRAEIDMLRRTVQDLEQSLSGTDPLSPSLRYAANHGPTQNAAFSHPQFQDDVKPGMGRSSQRQAPVPSGRPPPRNSSSSEGPHSSSAYGQAPGSGMSHSTSSEYYSSGGDGGGGGFMAYQAQMYQPPPQS